MFAKRKQSNWATGGLVVAALVVVNGIGFLAYRSVTAGRVANASVDKTPPSASSVEAAPVQPPPVAPPASATTVTADAAPPQVGEPSAEQAGSAGVAPVVDPAQTGDKDRAPTVQKAHRPRERHVPKPAATAKDATPTKPAPKDDDFILESNPYTHNR
jgi:hypothetical protein